MEVTVERFRQLFVLNIALQLFDGVATYHGVHMWGEGNPLILSAMGTLGVGATLLLFKAKACGFLVLLHRQGASRLAHDTLIVLATAYTALSFVPWTVRFLSLLA